MDETNQLAEQLSDRKKKLKAAMFGNNLASFIASSCIGEDASLGNLAFREIQLPFKLLDINEFKQFDNHTTFNFCLPLEHGERIITFKYHRKNGKLATLMSCFDRLGRLIATDYLDHLVTQGDVAQGAPDQFIMSYDRDSPKLCVYNSSMHRVRTFPCKKFSAICCNSKFVFGVWDTVDVPDSDDEDYKPDNDDGNYEHDDDDYDDD